VTEFDEELRKLVASMIEIMLAPNGVGLAAPQIGKNLNLFVMRGGNDNREVRVVINPKTIIEVGEDALRDRCLQLATGFVPLSAWLPNIIASAQNT
jgi:peptide deformylase